MRHTSAGRSGFTLIELMIVVSVIAIVATIAIPNLLSARVLANETSVVANLRSIWTGQAQFHASGYVDVDNDGAGEFGFFRELGGGFGRRTNGDGSSTTTAVNSSPISRAFSTVDANGATQRGGYRYIMVLPDATGAGVHETPTGAFDGTVDSDLAEITFSIYAWPNSYASTGNRTYFVNVAGDVLATDWSQYTSDNFHAVTVAGAAFTFGAGPDDSITGAPAIGTYGRDLNWWAPIQ